MEALLKALYERKSTGKLVAPGPTPDEVAKLLKAATTVPDHGRLSPYRFVVVSGASRDMLGECFIKDASCGGPLEEAKQEKIRRKASAAPCLIFLIFSPKQSTKIPAWEQMCSASCTGYAITLAAHSMGLGAIWKSFKPGIGKNLSSFFSLTQEEQVLGWINIGSYQKSENAVSLRPFEYQVQFMN